MEWSLTVMNLRIGPKCRHNRQVTIYKYLYFITRKRQNCDLLWVWLQTAEIRVRSGCQWKRGLGESHKEKRRNRETLQHSERTLLNGYKELEAEVSMLKMVFLYLQV